MADQITKTDMLRKYEEGFLSNIIFTGTRIYAHDVEGQGDNPKMFRVVWCTA